MTDTNPSTKKPSTANRKARPMLIDHIIEEARIRVIKADLELTFIKDIKASGAANSFPDYVGDERELQIQYSYFMARLEYFKALRDKIRDKEEQKRVAKEVVETTPETVTVKIDK